MFFGVVFGSALTTRTTVVCLGFFGLAAAPLGTATASASASAAEARRDDNGGSFPVSRMASVPGAMTHQLILGSANCHVVGTFLTDDPDAQAARTSATRRAAPAGRPRRAPRRRGARPSRAWSPET